EIQGRVRREATSAVIRQPNSTQTAFNKYQYVQLSIFFLFPLIFSLLFFPTNSNHSHWCYWAKDSIRRHYQTPKISAHANNNHPCVLQDSRCVRVDVRVAPAAYRRDPGSGTPGGQHWRWMVKGCGRVDWQCSAQPNRSEQYECPVC